MANTYKKVNLETGGGATDAIDLSYDNTVSGITATDVQAAIDELAIATGASYSSNFIVASWSLDAPVYRLTIPAATHGRGASPILQVYQENGLVFDEVHTGIEINNLGDITLTVSSNPDLRFDGKVIIK